MGRDHVGKGMHCKHGNAIHFLQYYHHVWLFKGIDEQSGHTFP